MNYDPSKLMVVFGLKGKTSFLFHHLDTMSIKEKILWVVPSTHTLDSDIADRIINKENEMISLISDLSDDSEFKLCLAVGIHKPKIIIFDGFGEPLTEKLLDLQQCIRKKYNVSVILTSKIIPTRTVLSRLLEVDAQFVFFWMGIGDRVKFAANLLMGSDTYEKYREQVTKDSFKFMVMSNSHKAIPLFGILPPPY